MNPHRSNWLLPEPAQRVLDFWFGPPAGPQNGLLRANWFRKDNAFDAAIGEGFADLVREGHGGGLASWDAAGPGGVLARIIVLDQFSRNLFRGEANAFAADPLALAAAQALVAGGQDRALLPEERMFIYLPFEHSEDLTLQRESVRLFGQLADDEPALRGLLSYADAHLDVIARFGRFPHRNAALGRTSTPEELAYLATPGAGF